jgi:hypothetical protein
MSSGVYNTPMSGGGGAYRASIHNMYGQSSNYIPTSNFYGSSNYTTQENAPQSQNIFSSGAGSGALLDHQWLTNFQPATF